MTPCCYQVRKGYDIKNDEGDTIPIPSTELYSFAGIILLMIISPGANQILVLQSGMVLGHQAAAYNVLGVASSMFLHALFAGLGVSVLITQLPGLHNFIQGLGAAYILYLAYQSLISAYRLHNQPPDETAEPGSLPVAAEKISRSFKKGFVSNILNVQTSFIFLSIFPLYMNQQHSLVVQSFFLTGIFIVLLLAWYTLLIALIATVRKYLLQPRVQMTIKAVTGSVLFFMGIKMFLR